MKAFALALAGALLPGCAPPAQFTRYSPERAVVRSIPSEAAQAALRERLSRTLFLFVPAGAGALYRIQAAGAPRRVSVDALHFEMIWDHYTASYVYRDVSPSVWTQVFEVPYVYVVFGGGPPDAGGSGIRVPTTEDAEVIVDALASLGARLDGGPPAPARK